MSYYRRTRYTARRNQPRVNRWVVVIGALVVLILVTRALANRAPHSADTSNDAANADLSLLNLGNGNTNVDANLAASGGAGSFPSNFLTDYCTGAVSQFGSKKLVALTFDAGSGSAGAGDIIRILSEKKTPASIFMTGKWAEDNPALAKAFADAGLGLYSHSYDHPSFLNISKAKQQEQLTKADAAITKATGITTTKPLFRPPFGDTNDSVTATVRAAGYCPILWTVDALDWQDTQTADGAKARVLDRLKPGAIVVMQIGVDIVPQLLPDLIDQIKSRGYQLVGLPQLFSDNPVTKSSNANSNTNANRSNANTSNTNTRTNGNANTNTKTNTNAKTNTNSSANTNAG